MSEHKWLHILLSRGLLAATVLALVVGCGGSGSSSSSEDSTDDPATEAPDDSSDDSSADDGSGDSPDDPADGGTGDGSTGGDGSAPSDEEIAAMATSMVGDHEDWQDMVTSWEDPDAIIGPMSTTSAPPADRSRRLTALALARTGVAAPADLQPMEIAQCDSGTMEVITNPGPGLSYEAIYRECTIDSPFISMFLDGRVSYFYDTDSVRQWRPDDDAYPEHAAVVYEDYVMQLSSSEGSLDMEMDGAIVVYSDPSSGRGVIEFNHLDLKTSSLCDGSEETGSFGLNYEIKVEPAGGGIIQVEMNGTMTGAGITTEVTTISPVRIKDGEDHPHDGELQITYGGSSVQVRYEKDGIWVNNTYHPWEDFKATYMDEEVLVDDDACLF
ncbi:hypothetical protein [Arhodomonas sp. SL1]|uniref:hypothetical protein n=1 Tax=Arhodomonas sp. SL1 TaxID=3425691 RepID=UPI003F884AAC